jgi:transcriptional regulator GlxA family with amidase domain
VLVLLGATDKLPQLSAAELERLRNLARPASFVGGAGGAVWALARLGLLREGPAAAPPALLATFRELQDSVDFQFASLVNESGRIATCAGGVHTSTMALAMVREYVNDEVANEIADRLLLRRPSRPVGCRVSISARFGFRHDGLATAINFIIEDLGETVTSQQIADCAGVSIRQLERLFEKYLQTSPRVFLKKVRLERATELLRNTDLPVIEIGQLVGFANPSHFGRCFALHAGHTPSAFRQLAKIEATNEEASFARAA